MGKATPQTGAGTGREQSPGRHPERDDAPVRRRYGVFYPTHHIVAVLPDETVARAAADALERAGWAPSDIHRYSGTQVLAERRHFLEHRTVTDRLAELVSTVVADEREARDEYLEAATRGAHFLLVHIASADRVDRARIILAGHDAWEMRYYGDSAVTDLPSQRRAARE
jgi:hypothetical protein